MTEALDPEKEGRELAVDTETPETILINRCNFQLVQRAIDDLPVHYRETLPLCEVEVNVLPGDPLRPEQSVRSLSAIGSYAFGQT